MTVTTTEKLLSDLSDTLKAKNDLIVRLQREAAANPARYSINVPLPGGKFVLIETGSKEDAIEIETFLQESVARLGAEQQAVDFAPGSVALRMARLEAAMRVVAERSPMLKRAINCAMDGKSDAELPK